MESKNSAIQIISKKNNTIFIVISIIILMFVTSIFTWSIVDIFYYIANHQTPNQEFAYDIKSTFWILFIVSNSLGMLLEIFLLICYFSNKIGKFYHLFESNMSMTDICFLYVLWTIWASIMTISGVHVAIPITMYFLIAVTWVLYIVKAIISTNKIKKATSCLLILLGTVDFKNKKEYDKIHDALNDIKTIINIKQKKSNNSVSVDNKTKQSDQTKRNDNGKTKKLEI